MFSNESVKLDILKKRAYNLRWATVPDGTIPLTAADPDFPCAEPIRKALTNYARDGYFSYGPAEGLLEFRNSLSLHYANKYKVNYRPDFILPIDSAASGIHLICKTFLKPLDEAIIFDPVDFLFRLSVESVHATAVTFPIPQTNMEMDFSSLELFINERTKMICLCNPLNPTGKVFTKKELTQLGNIAVKYNLLILSDEIWSEIIFAPHGFTSISSLDEEIKKRTVTVTGFSKSYGLASLRVGAILCSDFESYEKIFQSSLSQFTVGGCNAAGQIAATAALNECQDWLEQFVLHLSKMRSLCVDSLNQIKNFSCLPPEGCFVAFVNIAKTGMSSQAISDKLMKEAKVAVVPGLKQWFGEGAEGYIRISFATSEHILTEALDRIKKTMN
ncbi:MAG: hypothetical protein RL131_1395 [Bacteroidota bacterium]